MVTLFKVSVAVVFAGITSVKLVPPFVLTCHIYDTGVPVVVTEKLVLVPEQTVTD